MVRTTRKPIDGFQLLSTFNVQSSSMDRGRLHLNWRWNSTDLAKRLIRTTKITHFSDVGLTTDEGHILQDRLAEAYTLSDLQPDTKYTVCVHITRDWHPTPVPIPSGSERSLSSKFARLNRNHSDFLSSTFWSKVASGVPEPVRTVTERQCRVAVTSWFHWPALISSLVGIVIAVLISFSIFIFLKRTQTRLKKARREQKKVYCTDHTNPMLAKHSDAPVIVTCTQGHTVKCPHHRCPHCRTNTAAPKHSLTPSTTSSVLIPHPPHHHYHHHHHHHHRHHTHRHPLPARTQSPRLYPVTDATEKSDSEQVSCGSPLNPPSADLLSIDMAQSLSGSDSYQFSSTSSADDRMGTTKPKPMVSDGPASNTVTPISNNNLSPDDVLQGCERKRTVSFLLSERKKSMTEKLRSKSIDKTILDSWPTKKLAFGFRKPKKSSERNSTADGSINIPQVTVTVPDVPDVLETISPDSSYFPIDNKPELTPGTSYTETAPSLGQANQLDENSKPTPTLLQTNNVLSPTIADRDAGSATSSIFGSDRESNENRPSIIPVALAVEGFEIALDPSPETSRRDSVGEAESQTVASVPPFNYGSTESSSSSRGRSSLSHVSPPPCILDRSTAQQTTQENSIFFTQLIETL